MKPNNGENKAQTQNQHDDRVNPQTRALIRIELQHGAGRATGTGGTGRAGADIAERLLMVCGGATAQGSARTAGGSGRGGTAHCGGGTGAGAAAGGFGVGTGFGAGGHGGGRTGRDLLVYLLELEGRWTEDGRRRGD